MRYQSSRRGFGFLGILIALLIVAILAYFNWDKLVSSKEDVDKKKDAAQEQLESFKNQAEELGEKMNERLEKGLEQVKP